MCVQLVNLHIAVGECLGFPSRRLFLMLAFGRRSRTPEFRREQPAGAFEGLAGVLFCPSVA